MRKYRKVLRLIVNLFIAAMVPCAWLMMALGKGASSFAARGLWSLKFFTVLSNLFAGVTAVLYLLSCLEKKMPRYVTTLKYIASCAVALTFTVVAAFFGPIFGYSSMYKSANFWFHLVIPLVAMAETMFLEDVKLTKKENTLAVLPPLLYGLVYLVNILINGVGTYPNSNDFYGFAHWGIPKGIGIFAAILMAAWLLGLVMRKVQDSTRETDTD